MQTLTALLAAIPTPDDVAMARAQQHLDGLLKPVGSPAGSAGGSTGGHAED